MPNTARYQDSFNLRAYLYRHSGKRGTNLSGIQFLALSSKQHAIKTAFYQNKRP